eukprot:1932995-Amphidinium_carterae.1
MTSFSVSNIGCGLWWGIGLGRPSRGCGWKACACRVSLAVTGRAAGGESPEMPCSRAFWQQHCSAMPRFTVFLEPPSSQIPCFVAPIT